MVSPESIHVSISIQTEQIAFMYLEIYTYILHTIYILHTTYYILHTCNLIKKQAINLKGVMCILEGLEEERTESDIIIKG